MFVLAETAGDWPPEEEDSPPLWFPAAASSRRRRPRARLRDPCRRGRMSPRIVPVSSAKCQT